MIQSAMPSGEAQSVMPQVLSGDTAEILSVSLQG
jgi:hypothetical protein